MHNILYTHLHSLYQVVFFFRLHVVIGKLTVPTKDIQQVTLKTLHFYYTQALNYILPLFYFFLYHRTHSISSPLPQGSHEIA